MYTEKFKQTFKKNKEIRYSDIKYIQCFCFGCGLDMGGIHYIDTIGTYPLHIPLCNECWKKTGFKYTNPLKQ